MRIRITRRVKFRLRGADTGGHCPSATYPLPSLGSVPLPQRRSSAPSPTRAQARSQGSDLPRVGGVQRRRGSPRLGGGVGGSLHLLSPVASRPRLRPPRTGRRPCVRTSLSPPAAAVPVGARPAAQGGRALAPPVVIACDGLLEILLGAGITGRAPPQRIGCHRAPRRAPVVQGRRAGRRW